MPVEEKIEKDSSRLFHQVDDEIYRAAFAQLKKMRAAHPSYRDDQLLMRLLCWHMGAEGLPTR